MKNKKNFVLIFTTLLIMLSSTLAFASGIGGAGNTRPLGGTQIQFKEEYDQRMGYGYNGFIFIKDYKESQYGIYSPVKSGDAQPYLTMRKYLKENTQTSLGKNGEHLVGNTWWSQVSGKPDYNLKKGRVDPRKWGPEAYQGDGTGTYLMTNYTPAQRYEYRYAGYTIDGIVVDNPFFPADNSGGVSPELKNWYTFDQMKNSYPTLKHMPTIYNDDNDSDKAKRTFEQWFDTTEIGAKFKAKALQNGAKPGEEWDYWNKRMVILADIDDGAGIIKGWHNNGGRMWYQVFAIPKPPKNNITLTKLELIDPDTDEVIVAHTRELDPNDVMNVSKENLYYTNSNAVIEKGKTYKLRAEYWYNSIPDTVQSNGSIYVKVPPTYTEKGDDYVREDNWLNVAFRIAQNDIGFTQPVELYNSTGRKVNFVYPNEAHTVKFNVKHFLGQTAIGLDPVKNPKTTIDVEIRDGNNTVVRKSTIRADEILNPNSQITMEVNNIATPTTMLKACAKINPIHKEKGLNSNPQNDTICEVFAQAKNYAIKDLKVSPHYINVPDGVNATTQTLNFRFVVAHEGQDGYGDNPIVVVRQGGREIARASVSVSAGHEITEVWPIPANLRFGKNDFEVEVNPAPRVVEEFRSTGLDPYADNIKKDSVIVRRNPKCIECEVGPRTRNTWTEIFDMHEHLAHREYYTCCRRKKNGGTTCSTCSRCVTDSDRYWTETKNFYEEYKIEHVYFRSKWSKDTRGGDGWVDLLTSEGKIKAGYGFELKIVTRYETNRGSIPPVPNTWRRDCSYLSRYPGIGHVTNPNIVSLKMPYSDGFGNNVCYILNAENSRGSWDNNSKEYQLPYRDSFNIKTERKIYINENAKPGIQKLEIVTEKFDGYDPDAPVNTSNKRTLQDCKTVKFEILPNDDLKTHIVQ